MSYLKRVGLQRERNRVVEERRKRQKEASRRAASKALMCAPPPEPVTIIPKAPPAVGRCGKWIVEKLILFKGRCGLARGHEGACVRRELVSRRKGDSIGGGE